MADTTDLAAVKAEIRRRSDNFERFFAAGDAAGLVNDYYIDAPMMSGADIPLLKSRAEIQGVFEALVKDFASCKLYNVDVRVSGDRAYELGGAEIGSKTPGQPVIDARYLIVWRKVADGWRVETDFFAFGKLL